LANLRDHLHDGPNSRCWLLELDVVVALVGEHLTAIGRQLEQLGLLELPLLILALATLLSLIFSLSLAAERQSVRRRSSTISITDHTLRTPSPFDLRIL
jgi:hypothetical protein